MDNIELKLIKKYIDKKSFSTDISDKADINSPSFTGTPTAPTATTGTNTNQIATTAFVQQTIRNDYCNSLPPYIYTHVNGDTRIYYRNIFTPNYLIRWGQYTNATDIRDYEDYVSLTGLSANQKDVYFATYDRGYNLIEEGTTRVIINGGANGSIPQSQTMLMLGDSFLTFLTLQSELRTLFSEQGQTLTLLGSQQSASLNRHEGYAGWKFTDFTTDSKASTNPFWNSTTSSFDFSYYMTQKSYSHVDSVYIQLGTNDAKATSLQTDFSEIISAAQTIVSSILAYDSSIQIYLGLTVMPTLEAEKFAARYNGIGTSWLLRLNMQRLNAALINTFKSNSKVRIVAMNCVLDSTKDINDNVHPTSEGFKKMAQQLYDTMYM